MLILKYSLLRIPFNFEMVFRVVQFHHKCKYNCINKIFFYVEITLGVWSCVLIIVTDMINNDFVAETYISSLLLFDFIICASFTFISPILVLRHHLFFQFFFFNF